MSSRTFALSRQRRRRVTSTENDKRGSGATPAAPRLPHEHDENTDQPHAPRAEMVQAETDLKEGKRDTEARAQVREVFDRKGSE